MKWGRRPGPTSRCRCRRRQGGRPRPAADRRPDPGLLLYPRTSRCPSESTPVTTGTTALATLNYRTAIMSTRPAVTAWPTIPGLPRIATGAPPADGPRGGTCLADRRPAPSLPLLGPAAAADARGPRATEGDCARTVGRFRRGRLPPRRRHHHGACPAGSARRSTDGESPRRRHVRDAASWSFVVRFADDRCDRHGITEHDEHPDHVGVADGDEGADGCARHRATGGADRAPRQL